MRVLILGGGGREHALGWKLRESPRVNEIYFLPGNAGTSRIGVNLEGDPCDARKVLETAKIHKPDLVVVGSEAPLFKGVSDALSSEGFVVFGPGRKASMLEQEKAFAKDFMERHNVPTAGFRIFEDYESAEEFIRDSDGNLVIKASGPALGKGVVVCRTRDEALRAIREMMIDKVFGESGNRIVIEERLEGEEVSIIILTDGVHYASFPPAQDHKAVGDGDRGPNTGGMGAYAPAPIVDSVLLERIEDEIIAPTLKGLELDRIAYRGVLYFGLMITAGGPKVLEYNCRFGDPETQPLMLLTDEDLYELLRETARGNLRDSRVKTRPGSALCVVAAASGYPGAYQKGREITLDVEENRDLAVFHAGTAFRNDCLVTAGGRVLGVTAFAGDIDEAKRRAYEPLDEGEIRFDGIYFRRDIGDKGIRRLDESF